MKYTVSDGFPYYIELTEGSSLKDLFSSKEITDLYKSLSEEQGNITYAPGKWTLKQILSHLIDHERIMSYRAFRFSRKDESVLTGYHQDLLVDNSRANELTLSYLIADYEKVRAATNSFIESLTPEQLQLKGTAWKFTLTVEEYLRANAGHDIHHLNIIKEKYLPLVANR